MRDNWELAVVGRLVTLVPYRIEFVEQYHKWMTDPALLEATASEPLSLEEEYQMQKEWHEDPKKCTFIILANDGSNSLEERMAGDVNLFMHDRDDVTNAEIEIMIAEPRFRGKGFGKEALQLMMHYGALSSSLQITRFFAKIHEDNLSSLGLFRSLGFVEVNYVAAFQEHELAYVVAEGDNSAVIGRRAAHATQSPYPLPLVNNKPAPAPAIQCLARVRPLSADEEARVKSGAPVRTARASSYGEGAEEVCVEVHGPTAVMLDKTQDFSFHGTIPSESSLWDIISELSSSDSQKETVLCFGQTCSGKTFTATQLLRGLAKSFAHTAGSSISLFELRGDECYDLRATVATETEIGEEKADGGGVKLLLREDGQGRVIVTGLSAAPIESEEQALATIEACMGRRLTRGTTANEQSSRSHLFCTFSNAAGDRQVCVVDLAGSERWEDAVMHSVERLAEMTAINSSLGCLKQCLALAVSSSSSSSSGDSGGDSEKRRNSFIPLRNSKLTLALKEAISGCAEGAARIRLFVHLSPVLSDRKHTVDSLRFAAEVQRGGTVGRLQSETAALSGALSWQPAQVSAWVQSLEEGRFSHLADVFNISGRLLHGEWLGHVERRVKAAGGRIEEAHAIYDSFHGLVRREKKDVVIAAQPRITAEQKAAFAKRFSPDAPTVFVGEEGCGH